ncbi:hypothetical protein H8E65_03845 [Candidatus Bathyarchaeota archaeon]|nr:hypothetical protein [Candidatus Bathyarchaeota archaeon]MBL7080537.1 hypothetical protein [Candidatus Bathyarchaeota archaeon]
MNGYHKQRHRPDRGHTPPQDHRLTGPDDADHPAVKEATIRAAKNEGLLMGMSVTAILHIAVQKAEGLGKEKRIVAVLPDDGMKYLSADFYDNY